MTQLQFPTPRKITFHYTDSKVHTVQVSKYWVIAKSFRGGYNLYAKTPGKNYGKEYKYDMDHLAYIGNFRTQKRARDYAEMENPE